MTTDNENISTIVADKYTRFRTHLRRSWINVEMHSQVKLLLKEKCNDEEYANSIVVDSKSPVGQSNQNNIRLRGDSLLGFIDSKKGSGTEWALEWTLVAAIALFEAFIADIAALIYMTDPEKYLLKKYSAVNDQANYKVSEIIIKSSSRKEALEKIIEERLRGVFYGDPIGAFIIYKDENHKDGKLRLNLNTELDRHCKNELKLYKEMLGRRNAIVHNAGIIDEKYMREINDDISSKLALREKVKIDRGYLFSALEALDKIATHYIKQVARTTEQCKEPKSAKL